MLIEAIEFFAAARETLEIEFQLVSLSSLHFTVMEVCVVGK